MSGVFLDDSLEGRSCLAFIPVSGMSLLSSDSALVIQFGMIGAVVSALILGYAIGIQGWWLILVAIILWWPMTAAIGFSTLAIVPPTLELSDEYITQLRAPHDDERSNRPDEPHVDDDASRNGR